MAKHITYVPDGFWDVAAEERELWELVWNAGCLLWWAEINATDEGYVWKMRVPDEELAKQFLPLRLSHGQTWNESWAVNRTPADREHVDLIARQALEGDHGCYKHVCRYWCTDGTVRWIEEEVRIKRLDETRWRAMGICKDVTDSKQSETEIQYLVSSARCLLWHARVEDFGDEDLHWELKVSHGAAAKYLLPFELEEGQSWEEAWYKNRSVEARKTSDRIATEAVRSGKTGYRNEFCYTNVGPEDKWMLEDVHIEPISENRWYLVGVCVDITELKKSQADREALYEQLAEAMQKEVDELRRMLPICSSCKKVRDDKGYWNQIDAYISKHERIDFSHGICEECMRRLYPDMADDEP